ncbi:MAG TPA: SRPBCC domain-containing protein [Gemmatimonadaceae bacterium]|nr:SRPBCC domain-containing protein [Gemmatimonadaceae bacterium]
MNQPRDLVAQVTDRVIHVTVLLRVGPALAFQYFTKPDLLTTWLTAEADVEPKVGGKYELFWEPSDRENNSTIGCRVTAIHRDQFVAFQWRSPKQFKTFANGADPLTHVVVVFVPEEGGTRVHLLHSGWRSNPEWEEARVWQEQAWQRAFDKLAGVVSARGA